MTAILEINELSRGFGGLQAVDQCSFSVEAGTITGFVGPNGAGKSTVFNLVSGFIAPDAGEVRFSGQRIDGMSVHRIARLGLRRTFQIPHELKRMSVLENLMLVPEHQFGDRLRSVLTLGRRVAREELANADEARRVLQSVGLGEKAEQEADLLSGGQKKLLELARCLMSRPLLVLLDEPTAGVNPTLIHHLMEVMRSLHAAGITLLIIEHNMNVVTELCEKVVVLDRGHVIASGTPAGIQQDQRVLDAYLGGVSA